MTIMQMFVCIGCVCVAFIGGVLLGLRIAALALAHTFTNDPDRVIRELIKAITAKRSAK